MIAEERHVTTPAREDPVAPESDRLHPAHSAMVPRAEEQPTVPLWPDAARALGIGRSTAFAGAARGDIPCLRIMSRLVVPTAALRRMLQLDDPGTAA
jgi:hypothetical protein